MMRSFLLALLTFLMFACASATVATRVFPESSTASEPQIPVTASEVFEGCGGTLMPVINDNYEQAVVELTNEIRMQAGLSPLKRVEGLTQSARFHSADMSFDNYFDHNTFNREGDQIHQVCDTWSRIESFYTDWLALAENIAAGQRLPEIAVEGWMNSPDHRHNILSDHYSEIGVGYFEGEGEYHFYWVQNFGRTQGRFPIVLDGEKAQTRITEIPVYIYGDWSEMRLRINEGEWSDWIPFETEFVWDLPDEAGLYTVTAELRGFSGWHTTSDVIELVH